MIPAAFTYVRARDVDDAIRLLAEHGDDAKLLAGGHSLIPMMKLRLAAPSTIIDIGNLDIAGIERSNGRIRLGALTRHAALAASDVLRAHAPALEQAANELGDPQVRNRGTVGGACAHGDPSADYPAVMLALDATLTLTAAGGVTRDVRADDFFLGMFETALDPLEVLTAIAFDDAPASAYTKFHHPASGYAVVGAAVNLTLDGARIASARVALAGTGDSAFRALGVERSLAGIAISDSSALDAACAGAAAGIDVRGDNFATAGYRTALADVYVRRAVAKALQPR